MNNSFYPVRPSDTIREDGSRGWNMRDVNLVKSKALSESDMKKIARVLGYKEGWGYYKWQEHIANKKTHIKDL